MGEAKQRRLQQANSFRELETEFTSDEVDFSQFGFYDSPSFLAKERTNPRYLENYARWVMARPRTDEYDERVERIVPVLVERIAQALAKDNMQSSCVAASGMMTRMLDRLEIWSFGVAGCLTLEVKSKGIWRGLATVDDPDFPGAALGHSWVIAPPYMVADAAINLQHWGEDAIREYVPSFFIGGHEGPTVKPVVTDIISAQVRAKFAAHGQGGSDLHYRLEPRLRDYGKYFPARQYEVGALSLKYVPVAIRQTDCPLEDINTTSGIGRPAIDIWNEISPHLPT